jgi:cytochrome c biogenesis protein CcmG/thiol:disulfide interchange protein DsbE
MEGPAELVADDQPTQPEEGAPARRGLRLALQITAAVIVALMIALLGWQVFTKEKGRGIADAVAAGDKPTAPDFELPRLDGKGSIRLADLRGKVVVLNFWASWCEPCKEEAPRLQAAWAKHADQGVVVLGIDAQDFRGDANRFVDRYGATYPNVHDGQGSTLVDYGITGFPETWFVDREGRLVAERVQGPVDEQQLEDDIALALESK